jgi:histidinol dehydrogenase
MTKLTMRRIRYEAADAAQQLQALCRQLGLQADVVSPRSRALTEQVFGQALTPAQVVERICNDVRQRGVEALLQYTEQFDKVRLTPETLRVNEAEIAAAHKQADAGFLATVRRVRNNLMSFQMGLVHRDAILSKRDYHELRLRISNQMAFWTCRHLHGA